MLDSWYAWHSFKLRNAAGEFAEGDFVIAAPGVGILILEVKGGLVVKKEGQWLQNGKTMKMGPLDQAHRCRKLLLAKFKEKGIVPPAIGEGVVLPDTACDDQPTQADLEGLVLGARELSYLEEILPDFMKKAIPAGIRRIPSTGWVEFLHSLWCESWPLKMNLSIQVTREISDRIRLDEVQFRALQSVLENDIVVVKGGAGTGKTILARELAMKEAEAGKRVLVLTFTEALGIELAKRLGSDGFLGGEIGKAGEGTNRGIVTVSSICRFALKRLRAAGFSEPESYEPTFWEKVTRQAAESSELWHGCAWDTVIVDEAQDLGKYEWDIATRCAQNPPRIWCFIDEGQAFWGDRKVPQTIREKSAIYNLGKPYRCTPGIQALAEAYLGKDLDTAAVAGDIGKRIIGVKACADRMIHEGVDKEVRKLVAEGFKPEEIAVISLRGLLFPGSIVHRKKVGGYDTVMATDGRIAEHIVCDTFLRYKGLERPAIIVTDLQHEVEPYCVRMNIAVSRAYGVLRVVGEQREVVKDPILRDVLEMMGAGTIDT